MMALHRLRGTGQAVLRRHLVDKVPLSKLCDELALRLRIDLLTPL